MNSEKAVRQKLSNMDRVMNRLMAGVLPLLAILACLRAFLKQVDAGTLAKHWYLRIRSKATRRTSCSPS